MFDQNGYDLTKLEQLYAVANGATTTKHRNSEHITLRQPWFTDDSPDSGPHINHAYMFERKGYTGDALRQLSTWADYRPHFQKLIAMRPKWGLDFSIDYCDRDGNVFELLHWEYDGFEYQEIADKKEKMEEFLLNQDWDERAKTMLERKDEWHKLGFFEQSEWKTKFFGIDKERFKMVLWK
tara:strand:+ start:236 stop:778 length:543 start_codon:yes stop_codon:yes gene_type:complete